MCALQARRLDAAAAMLSDMFNGWDEKKAGRKVRSLFEYVAQTSWKLVVTIIDTTTGTAKYATA